MLRDINWVDPALHILMALAVCFAFKASPGLGAALFLWIREGAQRDPGDIFNGMNLTKYSLQKHAEIWPPAIAVELLVRFV